MAKILWVDDIRNPDGTIFTEGLSTLIIARNCEEALRAIDDNDDAFDVMYLDHDFGDEEENGNGYMVACYIEMNPRFAPGVIKLLTALGAEISEGRGSRVRIAFRGVRAVFHRPHPGKETDKGTLRSIKRFIKETGVRA